MKNEHTSDHNARGMMCWRMSICFSCCFPKIPCCQTQCCKGFVWNSLSPLQMLWPVSCLILHHSFCAFHLVVRTANVIVFNRLQNAPLKQFAPDLPPPCSWFTLLGILLSAPPAVNVKEHTNRIFFLNNSIPLDKIPAQSDTKLVIHFHRYQYVQMYNFATFLDPFILIYLTS